MKSSMWAMFGEFLLVVGDYLYLPDLLWPFVSVFEGLTMFETNPDISIYIYNYIYMD